MTEPRVMLFVQNAWNKRPPRYEPLPKRARDQRGDALVKWVRDYLKERRHPADRWWLVECSCADSGRAAIAGHAWRFKRHQHPEGDGMDTVLAGRILASGGLRA